MSSTNYISWSAQKDAPSIAIKSAKDAHFVLEDGSRLVDFISTSFQSHFGHSNQRIISAIKSQLDVLPITSPKGVFSLREKASQSLLDLLSLGGGKLFYTVSGSESVENALKMARQIKGKQKVLARRVCYHGASLGALSVTGDWRNDAHKTIDDWTVRIPEPSDDPDCSKTRAVFEQHKGEIAAVILETITGANGVYIPEKKWWDGVVSLCKEFDVFLIIDEVLCGFGRCGKNFAFQNFGLKPDFVCMSKGITGGYIPFGAVWTSKEVADFYEDETLSCGLTNYAHPLGLAALDEVCKILRDQTFCSQLKDLEECFEQQMEEFRKLDFVKEVRSIGLLSAVEFKEGFSASWQSFIDRGVYLLVKPTYLCFSPPFIMKKQELTDTCGIIREVLCSS